MRKKKSLNEALMIIIKLTHYQIIKSNTMSTALSYYFNEEHEAFRRTIRQFLEAEAIPHIDQWEADGKIPN